MPMLRSSRTSGPVSTVPTLILPGLYDSGPQHWQTHWVASDPACQRVEQADWVTPRCIDWVARLDAAVRALETPGVLVAHSSSCALVAHWVAGAAPAALAKVRGALLVAPTDPEAETYPHGPTGFAPLPLVRLPFASAVVASTDDPYVTLGRAQAFARAWGSRFMVLEEAGHINSSSGLGAWPDGYALLQELRRAPAMALA